MNALATCLIAWLLNALWQAPLIFAAAWLAARIARPAGPAWEHRLWVGALFAQILIPLGSIDDFRIQLSLAIDAAWAFFSRLWSSSTPTATTRVFVGPAVTFVPRGLHLSPQVTSVVLMLYAASLLYFTGRFAWALFRCYAPEPNETPSQALSGRFARHCQEFGIRRASLVLSSSVSTPQTIGIWKPRLLLPLTAAGPISDADLDAIFAHEAAHMRRADFAKNLIYTALSLPLTFHPAMWMVRSRIAASREMICDSLAAGQTDGRANYARSLLRMAALFTAPPIRKNLHAIGIFDAHIFERRIMQLTQSTAPARPARRLLIAAACTALALATATSAWALRLHIDDKSADQQSSKKIHVNVKDMTILTKVNPVYPVEAKKARTQGTVVLNVVIGTSGEVENISVKSGPSALQQSAIDAVRQWRWQPFLLNGNPVEVETEVNVIYSLAG